MVYPFRYILRVGAAVVVLWGADPFSLWAQRDQESTVRTSGTVANLFETLDPSEPLDGFRVTIPEKWTLEQARLLRYGTEPIPIRRQRATEPGAHLFSLSSPLTGPHELLLRVQMPDISGSYDWILHTLARNSPSSDSVQKPRFRTVNRRQRRVNVQSPPDPDPKNKALSLEGSTMPLRLRDDVLPALGQMSSFTIEFWLRTHGIDETVLSTWDGNESVAYPAEFVVDQGGRLRYYVGQPNKHRALRTGRPVADGSWHHIAAVYDVERTQLRLLLDGRRVDSLSGRFVPTTTSPTSMAVGGRLRRQTTTNEDRSPLFPGRLDELRVWGEARPVQAVRRMKNRPFQLDETEGGRRLVRLGFDDKDERAVVKQWPKGARRVPSTLSFQPSLRNLRAQTNGRTVTLQWAADPSEIEAFVVERSTEGEAFTPITELRPSDARQASISGVPRFSYTDEDVAGQVVFYRIRLKRENEIERTSGTIKIGLGPESEERRPVKLVGNFPNPFSKKTTVAFEVNTPSTVTISVWDVAGHRVAQLADGRKGTGYHEIPFEATDLPSGTYFVKLELPTETQTHQMVVLK